MRSNLSFLSQSKIQCYSLWFYMNYTVLLTRRYSLGYKQTYLSSFTYCSEMFEATIFEFCNCKASLFKIKGWLGWSCLYELCKPKGIILKNLRFSFDFRYLWPWIAADLKYLLFLRFLETVVILFSNVLVCKLENVLYFM